MFVFLCDTRILVSAKSRCKYKKTLLLIYDDNNLLEMEVTKKYMGFRFQALKRHTVTPIVSVSRVWQLLRKNFQPNKVTLGKYNRLMAFMKIKYCKFSAISFFRQDDNSEDAEKKKIRIMADERRRDLPRDVADEVSIYGRL